MKPRWKSRHFEFIDAPRAKRSYMAQHSLTPNDVCLVVSRNIFSEGFWIEQLGEPLDPNDTRYVDYDTVINFLENFEPV